MIHAIVYLTLNGILRTKRLPVPSFRPPYPLLGGGLLPLPPYPLLGGLRYGGLYLLIVVCNYTTIEKKINNSIRIA